MIEILAFEYQDLYDGEQPKPEDAVQTFLDMCKQYVNPKYIEKKNTEFIVGSTYIIYKDTSGGDKPMMIMMIGATEEMVNEIKKGVEELYISRCEDCNTIIENNHVVCTACSNKSMEESE